MLAMIVLGLCLSSCSTTPKPFPKADENSSESVAPAKSNESTEKKKPFPKDFKSLKSLAKKKEARAQFNLGLMYNNGQGTLKDPKQAARWSKKAFEAKDPYWKEKAEKYWNEHELWKYSE